MLTKPIATYTLCPDLCPDSFSLFITLLKQMISHVRTTHSRGVKIPGFIFYDPIMTP